MIRQYSRLTGTIVPLISLALGSFFLLLLFVLFSYDHHLGKLEQVIDSGELYSQKMQLSSALMEYIRTRALLTTQLIDTDDYFRQDEISIELDLYAYRFDNARQQLTSLPLSEQEQTILDRQLEIIASILPAQRKAVELAMNENTDDRLIAKGLLYKVVLPGQASLIASFEELLELARQRTSSLSRTSHASVHAMQQRSNWLIGPVLLFIGLISVVVIVRIRRIQSDLILSRDNLELTVTDRTRELRSAQDMLQSVLDTIPVSVYWMDTSATFMGCNARFAKDAKLASPRDVIGKTDHDMPWSSRAALYREEDLTVIESGKPQIDKIEEHRDADGKTFWLESSKVPLLDENGQAVGMLGIYSNITERKEAEEKLRIASADAEAANTAKSLFLANMSHEIRTPMNTIIGMSYLVLQTALNDVQQNYVRKVHQSAESLLGIINDILDFSKIEANRIELESTAFWLEDVFDNLSNLVGLRAEEKGVELLFDISPEIPTALVGDPLRLGQILVNLVSNAVKFTERGEVSVTVRPESMEGDSIGLRFSVRDDGVGMSEAQTAALFQPFCQADASTTRQYGGTGLGLSIAKHLTEMMGGKIWAQSEEGQGSTFSFTVFLQCQPGATPRNQLLEDMKSVRMLVVDDNASAAEILQNMLQEFGVDVETVQDGRSALARIESASRAEGTAYNLILVDWKMPDMDGIEVMQRLAALDIPLPPSVVMHTAYGREEIIREASNRGINKIPLLIKPVTQSGLLDTIAEALGRSLHRHQHRDERHQQQDYLDSISQLQGTHVLLVEDNELNQELALALLTGHGISVEVAVNGQQAVDMLEHNHYDGVLMDCQMPVMDGYTATRLIREQLQLKDLPILAMTANAMLSDVEKVLEAGMNDHIAKPVNVQDMFNTMARWIRPLGTYIVGEQTEQPSLAETGSAQVSIDNDMTAEYEEIVLPDIAGLDVEAALVRVSGNKRFYLKLLQMFLDRQPGKNAAMRAALAAGRWQEVKDAVHEAKGELGSIGATVLYEAAAQLQKSIEQLADKNLLQQQAETFQQGLDEFLQLLKSVLPEPAA